MVVKAKKHINPVEQPKIVKEEIRDLRKKLEAIININEIGNIDQAIN